MSISHTRAATDGASFVHGVPPASPQTPLCRLSKRVDAVVAPPPIMLDWLTPGAVRLVTAPSAVTALCARCRCETHRFAKGVALPSGAVQAEAHRGPAASLALEGMGTLSVRAGRRWSVCLTCVHASVAVHDGSVRARAPGVGYAVSRALSERWAEPVGRGRRWEGS